MAEIKESCGSEKCPKSCRPTPIVAYGCSTNIRTITSRCSSCVQEMLPILSSPMAIHLPTGFQTFPNQSISTKRVLFRDACIVFKGSMAGPHLSLLVVCTQRKYLPAHCTFTKKQLYLLMTLRSHTKFQNISDL